MSTSLRGHRGFALPMVILLMAMLTALLTAGLSRARTERQIAHASDETHLARAIAESGLQTYFGTTVARPADGDLSRVNLAGGYANVVVHVVRRPPDTTQRLLYLVRSTGVVINPDSGANPRALRTVAQFAEWQPRVVYPEAEMMQSFALLPQELRMGRLAIQDLDQLGLDGSGAGEGHLQPAAARPVSEGESLQINLADLEMAPAEEGGAMLDSPVNVVNDYAYLLYRGQLHRRLSIVRHQSTTPTSGQYRQARAWA